MVIVHALRAHRTPVQCHPLLRYLGHDTSLMPAYAFVWIGSQTVPVQLSPGILRSSSAKMASTSLLVRREHHMSYSAQCGTCVSSFEDSGA